MSTVDVLSTTGFSGQGFNTSEIKNKGIEGTLRVKVLNGKDFKFTLAGNIAWNRNILSKYSKKRVITDDMKVFHWSLFLPDVTRELMCVMVCTRMS